MRNIRSEKRLNYNRIFLYGDSFVDNKRLNTHKAGIRDDFVHDADLPKLWTEQIKNKINFEEFFNNGVIAKGPNYTMALIIQQEFDSDDLIIVVLSFHDVPSNNDLFENGNNCFQLFPCLKLDSISLPEFQFQDIKTVRSLIKLFDI